MRIARLGLDRYGRFTDRELVFDPAARLVVIAGANEAGKSTALAAACDALFGIDERSRFNFLHDYKDMRLSATLVAADGRSLSFARLKRRKAALVDPEDGTPLPDDCLAPFLGAHQRAAFLDIFGLDQERLRAGGRKLLAGGGDLDDTLVSAAPGLGRVADLRDAFAERAGRIFNPARRNSAHVLYRAIDRRKAARDQIRALEIREEEVRKLRSAARQASEARAAAVEAEVAAGQAAQWADMLGRAAGLFAQMEAEESALAALGPLPAVPAGFVARGRRALAAVETAQAALARAEGDEARAASGRAGIAEDAAILDLADAVTACDEERAAVAKARADLPRRHEDASLATAGLKRVAAGLGLADGAALRSRLPAGPLLARTEAYADRLQAHALQAEALALDVAAHAREAEAAAQADPGAVEDPEPLRRRLFALDGAEERMRALEAAFGRLKAARADLQDRLARLGPEAGDLETLCRAPLPALSVAEARLRTVEEAATLGMRHREAVGALEEQMSVAEARRAALDAGGTAPTEAALATARGSRDRLWHGLRPLAFGERPPLPEDREAAFALDAALAAADRTADERQRETRRLADLAQAEREIAECRARLQAAAVRDEALTARLSAATAEWAALWTACDRAFPADAAALAFLREVEVIRDGRSAILKQEAEGEVARAAVAQDRAAADDLRRDLGLPPLGTAPLRLAELRDAVERLERRHQVSRDRARDLARLARQREDLDRRAAALREEARLLAVEAAELLPPLAIRAGAPAAEVRAALGLWRDAAKFAAALADAEHRIAAIGRDEAVFAERAAALAASVGEFPGVDAAATVVALRRRLEAAREARARAAAADAALAERRAALFAARDEAERAAAEFEAVRTLAGDVPAAGLTALLDRLEEGAALAARLADAGRRLKDLAGGHDIQEVRAALQGLDPPALAARAAEAAAAHALARQASHAAVEGDAAARAALAALETREGAAAAAQEEQDAAAEIAEAVEAFTRDHVAARLVARAVERYREQHQNPIVTRASEAFAGLTLGRWSGIGVDYEAEPPRLAARRDGALFGADCLSEGTADQLFLALRIAAIEEHARRATPLPFMADDLFVSFDEPRTEAGLKLLAELGALTQVIVFTHHAHVAEAAVRAVGEACQLIRL